MILHKFDKHTAEPVRSLPKKPKIKVKYDEYGEVICKYPYPNYDNDGPRSYLNLKTFQEYVVQEQEFEFCERMATDRVFLRKLFSVNCVLTAASLAVAFAGRRTFLRSASSIKRLANETERLDLYRKTASYTLLSLSASWYYSAYLWDQTHGKMWIRTANRARQLLFNEINPGDMKI